LIGSDSRRVGGKAQILVAIALVLLAVLVTPGVAEGPARRVVAKAAPTYPELAHKMHLSGKVKLDLMVATNGAVTSVKFVGGNPVFEKSAVEAAKQWRFEPAQKETQEHIALEFSEQ